MVKPVLNKSGIKSGLKPPQIKDYLKQDIFWELPFEAETLFESINKGVPAVLNAPKSFFSKKIIQLAQNLSFAEDEEEKGRGIFSGIREILANARRDYSRQETEPEEVRPKAPGEENVYEQLKEKIYQKLVERIKEKQIDVAAIKTKQQEEKARKDIEREIEGILASEGKKLAGRVDRIRLTKEIMDRALGLGPIEDLLKDPSITEVMVNGMERIYVERKGKISLTNKRFSSHDELMNIIQRIVVPLGRRIDEASPMVDARLADGSRVNVIIPPLSLVGPTITIRKFEKESFTFSNLIHMGAITAEIVEFLRVCVLLRKNIIISGGTGTGKTTILNIVSGFIPRTERIVTIEDAAELRLPQDHVVSLESRPPNIEGKGAVEIRNLVINSLRMRPDRIVIGECRGGEALDMLQAMNTGHDGSLTTIHSNNPRDCLSRLETLVLMSGMDLPVTAIREQIVAAVNIVVQLSRFSDGSRKVTNICEVTGKEQNSIAMSTIFKYTQTGLGEKGKVEGDFAPTGVMPTFMDEIKSKGIALDLNIFKRGLIMAGALFTAGCSDQKIVFNGEVRRGQFTYDYQIPGDTTTEVVELLVDAGGWQGACVKEVGHSEVAYANANGAYRLEIKVPRKLGFPSAESFTLQAWAPPGVSSSDEKISNYASARPGESVYVRPFLLIYHTIEEMGNE